MFKGFRGGSIIEKSIFHIKSSQIKKSHGHISR